MHDTHSHLLFSKHIAVCVCVCVAVTVRAFHPPGQGPNSIAATHWALCSKFPSFTRHIHRSPFVHFQAVVHLVPEENARKMPQVVSCRHILYAIVFALLFPVELSAPLCSSYISGHHNVSHKCRCSGPLVGTARCLEWFAPRLGD